MKLKNAAKAFDWDSVYDAYSKAFLFKAQFSSFEAAAPDGSFSRRRVVSVASGTHILPRRVVEVQGVQWVLGDFAIDTFKDSPIRLSAAAKIATGLYTVLTPGQAALRDTNGLSTCYGHADYLKGTVNTLDTSVQLPQYEVYFSTSESLETGYFLRGIGALFSIRSVYFATEGYLVALSDEISKFADSVEVDIAASGTFDPVTETYSAGISTTGLLLPMQYLNEFTTAADARDLAGDRSLIVAKTSMTPVVGQVIVIGGVSWKSIRYTEFLDAWNIQVRRA